MKLPSTMKLLQTESVFLLVFILHQCLCQQSSQQYSQQSQSQPQYNQQTVQFSQPPQPSKVQLEDIERDNLKSSQTSTTNAQAQQQQVQQQVPLTPQQYISYPQEQIFYVPPQQAAALFQIPQQQVPSLYAAQPQAAGLVSSPQQAQQVYVQPYYTQTAAAAPQSYPYVDLGGFPLYPGVLPYVLPQTAATSQSGQLPQVTPNAVNDYFKSAVAAQSSAAAQVKTPQLSQVQQPSLKSAQPTQIPNLNNYLLSNTLPNAYYQPVSFGQPQNPQYLSYNSFYPVANPNPTAAKSLFSSGVKSTTPSAPTKLKEEPFAPVNNGNYRYDFATAEQNHYNKVRTG